MNKKELEFVKNNWSVIKSILKDNDLLVNEKHEKTLILESNLYNTKVLVYHKDDESIKDYYLDYLKNYCGEKSFPNYDAIKVKGTYYSSYEIVRDYLGLDDADEWDNNMEIHPKFIMKNGSKMNKVAAFILQEHADSLHPERNIVIYRPDKRKNSRVAA